jgi:hypothetical protein
MRIAGISESPNEAGKGPGLEQRMQNSDTECPENDMCKANRGLQNDPFVIDALRHVMQMQLSAEG